MNGDQEELIKKRKDPFQPGHFLKIKDDVGTCWYDLGIELGIETAKLQCIDTNHRTCQERARRLLEEWRELKASEATVGRLAYALIRIGKRCTAHKLLALCQSTQPNEQEGEQSEEPSERAGGQPEQPSERAGYWSNHPSEGEVERSEQVSEPEKTDDIFSLLAEVQELRKVVTGLERQPKQHGGDQATRQEGERSKQPSEHETADDIFTLLAEIKELTKIAIERKTQKKKEETLKKMVEDINQMIMQVQQLLSRIKLERK